MFVYVLPLIWVPIIVVILGVCGTLHGCVYNDMSFCIASYIIEKREKPISLLIRSNSSIYSCLLCGSYFMGYNAKNLERFELCHHLVLCLLAAKKVKDGEMKVILYVLPLWYADMRIHEMMVMNILLFRGKKGKNWVFNLFVDFDAGISTNQYFLVRFSLTMITATNLHVRYTSCA